MTGRPTLSLVIPVYHNEGSLEALHRRLVVALDAAAVHDFEIILVDDGSRDRSREVARKLCAADSRVRLVALSRNFGHQFAITAGFDLARGEAVLVMDADLQDPPEVIPEFVARWREGYDVVYGVRRQRPGDSRFKRATAALFYRLLRRLTKTDIALDSGDFRLLSRRAMDALNGLRERHRFVRGMVAWIGYRQIAVPFDRAERWSGESQYSLGKLTGLAIDAIVSFSHVPLQIATWLGFAGAAVCLLYLAYAVIAKLTHGVPLQGWASVVSVVTFIGSVQLIVLGMFGAYISRIYEELKGRPLYLVEERVGFEGDRTEERG